MSEHHQTPFFFNTQLNYFELFELTPSFYIDLPTLKKRYYALLETVHPDHFSDATITEQYAATQATIFVNEAYQTLTRSFSRAQYLLSLSCDDRLENHPADPAFLMEQMTLHQRIQSAISTKNDAELQTIQHILHDKIQALYQSFHEHWLNKTYDKATQSLSLIPYCERLTSEIEPLLRKKITNSKWAV